MCEYNTNFIGKGTSEAYLAAQKLSSQYRLIKLSLICSNTVSNRTDKERISIWFLRNSLYGFLQMKCQYGFKFTGMFREN